MIMTNYMRKQVLLVLSFTCFLSVFIIKADKSDSDISEIKRARKERRELFEDTNYKVAFSYVKTLTSKNRKEIQLKHLLKIHYFILKNIDTQYAGILRPLNVKLLSLPHVRFPQHRHVPHLMNDFIKWLHSVEGNPVKIATRAFCKLAHEIHPFVDGNGRTSRLFMNLLLMQAGYQPIQFHKKLNTYEYYNVYIPALNRVLFYNDFTSFDKLIISRLRRL
jgi:Fic family protein